MISEIKSEIDARSQEIEKYLEAISIFDRGMGNFYLISNDKDDQENDNDQETVEIDDSLIKILKATTYLLLYNLIEITVTLSMKEISIAINNEKKELNEFINKIKLKWLREKYKSFKIEKELSSLEQGNLINYNAIIKIIDEIVNHNYISLTEISLLRAAGNYDSQNINKLFKEIGLSGTKISFNDNEISSLDQVKMHRNNLSHGSKSFSQIGGDVTVKDLIQCKENIMNFITHFLEDVQNYIIEKQYLEKN